MYKGLPKPDAVSKGVLVPDAWMRKLLQRGSLEMVKVSHTIAVMISKKAHPNEDWQKVEFGVPCQVSSDILMEFCGLTARSVSHGLDEAIEKGFLEAVHAPDTNGVMYLIPEEGAWNV